MQDNQQRHGPRTRHRQMEINPHLVVIQTAFNYSQDSRGTTLSHIFLDCFHPMDDVDYIPCWEMPSPIRRTSLPSHHSVIVNFIDSVRINVEGFC